MCCSCQLSPGPCRRLVTFLSPANAPVVAYYVSVSLALKKKKGCAGVSGVGERVSVRSERRDRLDNNNNNKRETVQRIH